MHILGIYLPEDIEWIVTLFSLIGGAAGFLIARYLEARRIRLEEKQLGIDEDNLDKQRNNDVFAANEKLLSMMLGAVEPLSQRIALLEKDSSAKQERILDLENKIHDLTKTIHRKDLEIEDLGRRYQSQVEISRQQEIKIQDQARRISELEEELKQMKRIK
jgi:chromosome segregation ATPase